MHSSMFSVVKKLYNDKLIENKYLDTAIKLGWITEEEKTEILEVQETETITV